MKTFSVQQFITIPKYTLKLFGPIVYESEKECYITLKKANEIRNIVWTSDDQIYDALALHNWLNDCRENQRNFCVIPGRNITCIHGLLWYESFIRYTFRVCSTIHQKTSIFFKYPFKTTNLSKNTKKTKKKLNIVTVSQSIHTMILRSKKMKSSDLKIPSENSAFKIVQIC